MQRGAFVAGWQRTWKSWGISSGIVSTLERSDDQRRMYARGHKDDEKNKMALDALNEKLAEFLTDEICENL